MTPGAVGYPIHTRGEAPVLSRDPRWRAATPSPPIPPPVDFESPFVRGALANGTARSESPAMSAKKTASPPPFTGLLHERCPAWAEVSGEVQLTSEPLRVDDVIEVCADREHDPSDTGATLRERWRFIVVVGLLEYKSAVWPFQRGDLSRLIACGMLWRTQHQRRKRRGDGSCDERLAAHEVSLLLVVPSVNDALRDELDDLGLTMSASDTGCHLVTGAMLPLVVINLRAVAEREDVDLLHWFAGQPLRTIQGRRWMARHWSVEGDTVSTNATPALYGYDEFIDRLNRELTPAQRLRSLAWKERLAGHDSASARHTAGVDRSPKIRSHLWGAVA